jgi:hypothetical protein
LESFLIQVSSGFSLWGNKKFGKTIDFLISFKTEFSDGGEINV